MPRKIPVAVAITKPGVGDRRYHALDRQGKEVFSVKVYDCGHGAFVAHRAIVKAGYTPTQAEWTQKVLNQFYAKAYYQESRSGSNIESHERA